jgi:hypothetical protein
LNTENKNEGIGYPDSTRRRLQVIAVKRILLAYVEVAAGGHPVQRQPRRGVGLM